VVGLSDSASRLIIVIDGKTSVKMEHSTLVLRAQDLKAGDYIGDMVRRSWRSWRRRRRRRRRRVEYHGEEEQEEQEEG